MLRQYNPQRFRRLATPLGEKRIGTISVGTIIYIQDGLRPFRGFTRPILCREPWIVEAWIPRDDFKWEPATRRYKGVRISRGHLAQVRSLRDRRRVQLVADWILHYCVDEGLDIPRRHYERRQRSCR